MTQHLRVLRPCSNIYAFYDGRIVGHRLAPGKNWVDDGALSLGIASYAIVDCDEALIYDTHVSVAHGEFIRGMLADAGVKKFTVVLSHWHLDHIAGTAAFAGCPVIANVRTAEYLAKHQDAIERGSFQGPPGIRPLIQPTQTFEGRLQLQVGALDVALIAANIHSDDATVVWLAAQDVLLAGDTLEDTITYVDEPQNFDTHLNDLDRLWALHTGRILPNHGDPDMIAAGGYEKTLIRATQQYIRTLKRCVSEPDLRRRPLRELISGPLEAGWIKMFAPYEAIHRQNVERVVAAGLN